MEKGHIRRKNKQLIELRHYYIGIKFHSIITLHNTKTLTQFPAPLTSWMENYKLIQNYSNNLHEQHVTSPRSAASKK